MFPTYVSIKSTSHLFGDVGEDLDDDVVNRERVRNALYMCSKSTCEVKLNYQIISEMC